MMTSELQGVAIIGMSGRFPKANSITEFWNNCINGVDGTREFTIEEIVESGVAPEVARSTTYVKRGATLDDIDKFDAGFFGYLPQEAAILDPQARIFLECVQTALDDAGCDPERYHGSVGVYAGTGLNNYLLKNILRNPGIFEDVLDFQTIISSDKDFLSTQVNYKFNLTGPGVSIQTACSTSLVAIQMAYQSLLTYQCDIAISGGTHIRSPRAKGTPYKEGEIFSSDGYCRPFDKDASGTIFGEGVGVVILKRLEDAIEDGDHIYGVIRGAAINNDGSQKVSYAAPSVKGQAEVVAMAHTLADVTADEIGYVEAHGTGTKLGDPIEIRALTQAFSLTTDKKNFCAIGSGKSMIGHLDVAAGVAGLIRSALALHHKTLPPTLHFKEPNPELKLDESPFYVTTKVQPWQSDGKPRIAAVSSFGVGGTNAHAVLQEAPDIQSTPSSRRIHVLPLSAKTPEALKQQAEELAGHLKRNSNELLEDVAFTLQTGRRQFQHRKIIVCESHEEAIARLPSSNQTSTIKGTARNTDAPVLFMFSGQGSQFVAMARDLYDSEPVFAQCLNACATAVEDIMGFNFLSLIYSDNITDELEEQVKQTAIAQPALYAIECGVAKLWEHYGVVPKAMIGHSIGEFAAAHMAGVFSLEEGARIVATRGKLMQQMQPGSMLGLRNAVEDVEHVLEGRNLDVVVINGPELTVVGGSIEDIKNFKAELESEDIKSSLLHTSHAFHSYMMEDAVAPFIEEVSKYKLNKPNKPFISNVTGDWITDDQATDPAYWGSQLRSPVQFAKGIATLCSRYQGVLLEVGPGQALTILCQQQEDSVKQLPALSSVRHPKQEVNDQVFFLRSFGGLWANGVDVNLSKLYFDEMRHKVSLPTYPFQRKRYWIEASVSLDNLPRSLASNQNSEKQSIVTNAPISNTVDGRVRNIWIELLGCDDVQAEDSFYDLGGHSLVASQMLARVQEFCRDKVTLELLNNHGTFGEFCQVISELATDFDATNPDTKAKGVLVHEEKSHWPLSPQQKRLWFFHELNNLDPAYNLAQTILVEGDIDLSLLKQAMDYVVAQHEALNTVFTYQDNEVVAIPRTTPVESIVHNLTGETEEEKQEALVKLISDINSKPKNLEESASSLILFPLADDRIAMVFFLPHLLTDGLSFNILYQQINKAYQNLLAKRSIGEGIEVPYQYSDYVDWLNTHPVVIDSDTLGFWHRYLDGVPDMTQLPMSNARPMELSSRGSGIHFTLDNEQSQRVRQFCQEHRITPFVFFLAQLYITIWKYSGQSTHVVGAPFANRQHDDFKSIVGFFVDMIPIRGDIEPTESASQFVKQLSRSFAQAWDHFDVGLDKIVEASGVSRQDNAHPLFQVTFTYLSYLDNTLGTDNFRMRQLLVDRGVSEYDLSLYMWEEDVFTGFFEFATDLFSHEAISRLQDHFIQLMEWVLSNASLPLSQAVFVNQSDLERLQAINSTTEKSFLNKNFVDLFKHSAQENSDKPAVKTDSQQLSYRELDLATDALALQLKHKDIGSGSFVGVYTERSINTLVSLIAILKSGAAYIPLDPNFPEDRLLYIIENSETSLLLTDEANKGSDVLNECGVPSIVLPDLPNIEAGEILQPYEIQAEQLAYVIYTSGSTGLPKGVPIKHEALANFLLSSSEKPGINDSDSLLALTTTSFDISFLELLLPLLKGAAVVIADYYTARDGEALASFVDEHGITMMQATPVTWSLLLDAGWKGRSDIKMLSGGEPLSKNLATKLLEVGGELWNCYGPTECTIWSSYERILNGKVDPTIGAPIHNTQYYILDSFNNVLPPGIIGELAIAGVSLSPGYKGRDDLTTKVFLDVNVPGESRKIHAYKTGDLAQLTDKNMFRCLGRTDFQVKIRGYRVELSEIEHHVLTYPSIEEACCTLYQPEGADKELVVYYRSTNSVSEEKLRSYLSEKLPSYMVPKFIQYLPEFPKTANLKIDRKNLPVPVLTESRNTHSEVIAPTTIAEDKIKRIWQEVLNRSSIGIEDNFFDLGGHSLIAARVVREMNRSLSPVWKVRDIFQRPTIKALAVKAPDEFNAALHYDPIVEDLRNVLEQARLQELPNGSLLTSNILHYIESNLTGEQVWELNTTEALHHSERNQWHLSPQQKRLWFFSEYTNNGCSYNLAQSILVEGDIQVDKLKSAVDYVLSKHESLNTILEYHDNEIMARKSPNKTVSDLVDLSELEPTSRKAALEDNVISANRSFRDLFNTPITIRIYVLDSKAVQIVIFSPHIFIDGFSQDIFCHQIQKAYENLIEDKDIGHAIDVDYQYSDYVDWLQRNPSTPTEQDLEFWKNYLSGVPDLIQLPTTYARPMELTHKGSSIFFELNEHQSELIREKCKSLGTTVFSFLLSTFYLVLWRYTGQDNIVVGVPFANREREEFKNIIGYFVDMIPVHSTMESKMSFEEFVQHVHLSFSDALEHSHIGLENIIEAASISRNQNANPLFQVAFTYLSYITASENPDTCKFRQTAVNRGVSDFDLALYMWEESEFKGFFEYSEDLFSEAAILGFQTHFNAALQWALRNIEAPISELVITDANDIERSSELNNTDQPEYLSKNYIDVFAQSVREFPDNEAVRANGQSLTYKELDITSSALSQALFEAGVSQGDYVGVFLERGLNTLVSILGIFKAGAVYVPLDPKLPVDRLQFILQDSGVKVILTDSTNETSELLNVSSLPTIVLPENPPIVAVESQTEACLTPDDIAYIIYTSGSTGIPKGVPIRHEALANFSLATANILGIVQSDVLSVLSTVSFDFSLLELMPPLVKGAAAVIGDYLTARDSELLANFIKREKITFVQVTPVVWTMLLDSGWSGDPKLKMLSAGEPLSRDLASRLLGKGAELWNAYGPTECTIVTSYEKIESSEQDPTIGKPISNVRYYVLDKNNNVLPPGLIGELAIGGYSLSPGYKNREELNAKSFIEISVPDRSTKQRVYKTGDLAKLSDTGNYKCLGRVDFQVKIRGFRIELSEIEHQLNTLPGIEESCCVVFQTETNVKRLVAYYRSAQPVDVGELKAYLASKLPSYMVPSFFIYMKEFPKSSNLKIDRKQLPQPDETQIIDKSRSAAKPTSSIEQTMVEIWCDALGVSSVSIDDDFFDLGGHSQIASLVIRKMNNTIGHLWQVRDLFITPTIRGLAQKAPIDQEHKLPLVFPVQSLGAKIPFFLVAGVYADTYYGDNAEKEYEQGFLNYFSNIISVFGRDRPVYGLRARGMFNGETMHSDIHSMVDEYVAEIKRISPTGPYLLGGECLGGNLAMEIAQRLKSEGDEVELLVLMDTYMPTLKFQIFFLINHYARLLKRFIKGEKFTYGGRSNRFIKKLLMYRAKFYKDKMLLVVNEEWNRKDPLLNWNYKKVPHMSIEITPGDHTTRLREYGSDMSDIFYKHLSNLP